MQSCWDESALHGFQRNRCIKIGPQVHACTLLRSILWQGLVTFVHDFDL